MNNSELKTRNWWPTSACEEGFFTIPGGDLVHQQTDRIAPDDGRAEAEAEDDVKEEKEEKFSAKVVLVDVVQPRSKQWFYGMCVAREKRKKQ